jgi:hypothetical protein
MGLPSAGKTTLAKALAPRLNAVHFNPDDVRANINKDLGFGHPDRIEQVGIKTLVIRIPIVAPSTHATDFFQQDRSKPERLRLCKCIPVCPRNRDTSARHRCPAMPLKDHDAREHIAARAEAGPHDVS